jgi:hypothetical protein
MYDLTLGQMVISIIKNRASFMPHAFNQNEHLFGQCAHFSQIEPFEKP